MRQNAHAIAQPTCVEMQKVIAGVSGMKTDSISLPSASFSRNFSVPSTDVSRLTIDGVLTVNSRASVSRSSRERSVIAARICHAAAVKPREHLACVEPLMSTLRQRGFERRPFELGQVVFDGCGRGVRLHFAWLVAYDLKARVAAPSTSSG